MVGTYLNFQQEKLYGGCSGCRQIGQMGWEGSRGDLEET